MGIPLGSAVPTGSFGDPHLWPAPITASPMGRIAHRHGSLGDPLANSVKMEVTSAPFVSKPTLPLPFIGIGTQHVDIGRSPGAPKNAEKDRWDKKHL
jgi:hypothetical protein